MQKIILSTAYLPPIQYVSKFLLGEVVLEAHENYIKQSYRNRCNILAANGAFPLTIPVVKVHGTKSLISEARIDYDLPWQKNHFKSIESAYRNSPYYEHYIDDLKIFYNTKYDLLLDFNADLLTCILRLIGIKSSILFTACFEREYLKDLDYRFTLSPKSAKLEDDPFFRVVDYYQVFEDRYGFTPNLSILDLLFNEGPFAKSVLEQSVKRGE